ncbi:sulfurtransferase [Microbacterium sp. SORGH_AS_0888]|uniref:sulfurtransferase n=1 Tax=Microbacterium sp. SORGH_AS_0888 TaxID=3041791 RepID=UPI00277FD559|nr:rhodanese-like domain-containing protein [Microbacterium sp. SORGH_AS_0888]MDQ1129274.1 thiosulfate/3-mercaptopyruvate sulfurtransferase [Microbacterium sp. SORGH_AS_0888]
MAHLIDPDTLAAAVAAGARVRLLDVRWRLDVPEGRPAYLDGHLPGAVYVDLERELSTPGHPEEGRHPLPSAATLARSIRRWGVDEGDLVVAYDDNDGVAAARLWWLLRRRGLEVRVLDGGLGAWIAAGGLLESGDVLPVPGSAVLRDADPGVASIDDAAQAAVAGRLVDVRGPQHYRGTTAGSDPAAGHIPGAVNVPTLSHVDRSGRLRPPEQIRRTFSSAVQDVSTGLVLYCSSGIASAHSALALAHSGIEARVFPGSWSRWSRARDRPVASGPRPWGDVGAR